MGKGGGALSTWLKEFTALVFTQTIQAFIYAIIILIILYGMNTNRANVSANDSNSALGLMATFALLSVFKVEELAKKIFGLGNTKASPGNAMKSIAKTAIAAKLGKRVLNNAGKIFGGIGAITKSRQDNRKTKARLEEDMQDLGFKRDEKGKVIFTGKSKAASASGSGAKGASGKSSVNGKSGAEPEINNSGSAAAASIDLPSADISAADRRRIRNAVRTYEDKVSEIKKARNQGIKDIVAGSVESIGGLYGGVAGGILGGADGNLDEMIQGIMAGAGVGDVSGEMAVNAIDRSLSFVQRNYKRKGGISNKKLEKTIKDYSELAEKLKVNYGSNSVDDI